MNKQKKGIIFATINFILLTACFVSAKNIMNKVNYVPYYDSERISEETGIYTFNPSTILTDNNDEMDMFTEKNNNGDSNQENSYSDVILSEKEIFAIANTFSEYKWNEKFDEWSIEEIKFQLLDCEKGYSGPFSSSYTFTNRKIINGKQLIVFRSVMIYPSKGYIKWGEYAVNDDPNYSSNYLELIKVSATGALSLAEETEGKTLGEDPNNQCIAIYQYLFGAPSMRWVINFTGENGQLNNYYVDTISGEVEQFTYK